MSARSAVRHSPEWLHSLLVTRGGFTVESWSGEPIRHGYAVCANPDANFECRLDEWDESQVAAWIWRCRAHLASGVLHLGGWLEPNGTVCLDLVRVVAPHDRDRAVALGNDAGQRAIFDLGRSELVHLARCESVG